MSSTSSFPVILSAEQLVEYLVFEAPDYTCDDLVRMLFGVGRNHAPNVVAEMFAYEALHPGHAAVVVPEVWSDVEHPMASLDRAVWRDLFTYAGYTYNGRRRAKPRKPRVLYRGADEAHRDGWSWTDDRTMAQWFADRPFHRTPGQVWQATVEPDRLLARITSIRPGENEWVVDTDRLAITPAALLPSRTAPVPPTASATG